MVITKGTIGRNPHALRHGRIYELLDRGWRIEKVASFVGHSDVDTTYKYVDLGPADHRAEHARVGERKSSEASDPAAPKPDIDAASSLKALHDQGILSTEEYLSKLEMLIGL